MRAGRRFPRRPERPGRATLGETAAAQDERIATDAIERLWPWFNLLFAGLTLLSLILVLGDGDSSWTRRLIGLPVLAVCVASYRWLVRPYSGLGRPCGWGVAIYPAIAVGSVMALVAIHNSFWFFSLVVFFQLWMLLPIRAAAPVSAGLSLFLWAHGALADGATLRPSLGIILIFLATAAASTMLGVMINAIVRQSRQRLELIRQLEAERRARVDAEREAGALAERARLSRDLHDTLAQGFTSIVMHLEAADAVMAPGAPERRPVADARRIARDSLGEVRRLVWALRPTQLRAADLAGALDRMVQSWSAEHHIAASFRLDGDPGLLPPAIEVTLLRIAQEALTNISRHAGATTVDVVLTVFDDAAHLDVRDDGRGFDPGVARSSVGHLCGGYGLPGIRERVVAQGGTVEIETAIDAGTTVAVVLPRQSHGACPGSSGGDHGLAGQDDSTGDRCDTGELMADELVAEEVRWPDSDKQCREGVTG